jgi:hypothetical protein
MTETYKSLLEHGISIAINDKIIEYHPTDDSMYRKLRDWKVSVAKQYSNISFEEQQSLVGLSKIVSNILEDSKAVYYATKAREIVERSQKDSFE